MHVLTYRLLCVVSCRLQDVPLVLCGDFNTTWAITRSNRHDHVAEAGGGYGHMGGVAEGGMADGGTQHAFQVEQEDDHAPRDSGCGASGSSGGEGPPGEGVGDSVGGARTGSDGGQRVTPGGGNGGDGGLVGGQELSTGGGGPEVSPGGGGGCLVGGVYELLRGGGLGPEHPHHPARWEAAGPVLTCTVLTCTAHYDNPVSRSTVP